MENELDRRAEQWDRLLSAGGPDDVSPSLIRTLGIYGGAAGIWVDLARTKDLTPEGAGATVGVLHTGRHYPDDLGVDRLLYHYPATMRPGRDEAEIKATKNAAGMGLPLFVITPGRTLNLRTVRRGTVLGWDDELALFRIGLDTPLPAIAAVPPTGAESRREDTTYRRADEASAASPRDPFTIDPDKIDRGLRGHARTQNALADWLAGRGITALGPSGRVNFDIAWRKNGIFYVGEVKSLTAANEAMQLRLGLGQVLDYVTLMKGVGEENVVPVLVAEHEPTAKRWQSTCARLGVLLAWPEEFASLG